MHIPRQQGPNGPRARAASGASGPEVLVGHRDTLVRDLRAVGYWQRLVQARTDLVVAGLLYSAPSPAPAAGLAELAQHADEHCTDLPSDLDVRHVLYGLAPLAGVDDGPGDGPGDHLERLRRTALLLGERRRALQQQLDAVDLALADSAALAAERAEARPAPA